MADEKYTPRLKELYYASVRDALKEKFGYTNVNQIPKFDKMDHTRGMDITIVTTAKTNEEGKALLDAFHFPFKQD